MALTDEQIFMLSDQEIDAMVAIGDAGKVAEAQMLGVSIADALLACQRDRQHLLRCGKLIHSQGHMLQLHQKLLGELARRKWLIDSLPFDIACAVTSMSKGRVI